MSARLEPQLERGHRVAVAVLSRAPVATAVPVLIVHLSLLAGWISGAWRVELTTRIKCNTAFCVALAAASVLLLDQRRARATLWARVMAVTCVAVGTITLLEYAIGFAPGLDQLLSPDPAFARQSPIAMPGRMAPNTAAELILLGTGLFLTRRRGPAGAFGQAFIGAAGFVAALAALGYLYDVAAFYRVVTYLRLSQVAAASFLLLSLGAICLEPERQPIALLASAGPGGSIARRLVAFVAFAPALAGLVALSLVRRDFFDPATGMAVLVMTLMILFALAALAAAHLVRQVDAERAVAQRHRAEVESERSRLYEAGVVAIANLDADGRIRVANDRFLSLIGHSRADLEASGIDANDLRVADFNDADRQAAQRIRDTGSCGPYRSAIRTRTGEVVPLLVGAAALEGGVRRVAFFIDLREQHQLETRLRAAMAESRRLAQVVEESSDFIGIADLDGRALYLNHAGRAMVGLEEDEVRTTHIPNYFFPEEVPKAMAAFERVLSEGHAELETRLRHFRTGEGIPVAWHIFPLRDERGAPQAIATVTRDQRERRRTEEERERLVADLREAVRLSDLFVGILGHDLRNPLNAILAAAYVARNAQSLERAQQSAERIVTSTQRMARLVTDLLDFTRIRAGRGLELRPRRMDLRALCVDVIEELREAQPAREIACEMAGDATGVWDGDRLAQAVSNLVANALQHGAHDQPVHVVVDGTHASRVAIEVRNRGEPIPSEVKERLFQPFFESGERRASGGLGLGLYISREIVRHHRGELRAVATGGEIVFRIELPRAPDEAREGARSRTDLS